MVFHSQVNLLNTLYAHLASVVKGEPEEEDVREGLDHTEETINNPVGEPLGVILLGSALDGFDPKQTGELV